MPKLCFILGTRPEIIKLYSCIKEAQKQNLDFFIIHSNQHYDSKMDQIFFEELNLPKPKYNLNIGSGLHGQMTGQMLEKIEQILLQEKPSVVIVQGDTNTVLAGSLSASKIIGIKIVHIEAGLRSYNRDMPEEINRIMTDHIADFLFAPTLQQAKILENEGIEKNKIFVVGNTIVDAVLDCKNLGLENWQEKVEHILNKNLKNSNSNNSKTLEKDLEKKDEKDTLNNKNSDQNSNKENQKYILLTCHRPSNTDNLDNFVAILESAQTICEQENQICIFPLHPRLKKELNLIQKYDKIKVIEPVGFLQMLSLETNSEMILTDSGGIQEESCILEKKCIILRTDTERPETVEVGGAVILDNISKPEILEKYQILKDKQVIWSNPFGDGQSAVKILKIISQN